RLRHADQLHEGVCGADLMGEAFFVERIADDALAARRQFRFRALTNEGAHGVAALEQFGDQAPAEIARAAGDKNVSSGHLSFLASPRWRSATGESRLARSRGYGLRRG